VTKAELAGLHGDIEVMLSTMAQVTQVSTTTAQQRTELSAQPKAHTSRSDQVRSG
jgi:hypothetical protein